MYGNYLHRQESKNKIYKGAILLKKVLTILVIIMLLIMAFFASQIIIPGKPAPAAASNPPAIDQQHEPDLQSPTPSENAQIEKKVYDKGGRILVYNHASPEVLEPLGEIKNGAEVSIFGKENDFYYVRYAERDEVKEGYIPTWYLDDNKAAVAECDYGYKVLKEKGMGLLYPGGPEIVNLEQGKLLKPFLESGDWVQVDIMVFDIPAVVNAWVKKDDLAAPSEMLPNEGFLPSDAELYFVDGYKDIKASKPHKEAYSKGIFIIKRENGYAYVGAAGGWNAWVDQKWIKYTDKDLK